MWARAVGNVLQSGDDPGDVRHHSPSCHFSMASAARGATGCVCPLPDTRVSVIAVDTLMAGFCLLSIWLSLRVMESPPPGGLRWRVWRRGLAVTSKYNGLPIVAVPLLACVLSGRCNVRLVMAALGFSAVGFLMGTPYALLAIPDFLNGMAQEIVHYGILGHGSATVEPGWPHALRYLDWRSGPGGGLALTILGIIGVGVMLATRWRAALIVLAFPAGFLALMLSQRVAAFSNMLVTPRSLLSRRCVWCNWSSSTVTVYRVPPAWRSRR